MGSQTVSDIQAGLCKSIGSSIRLEILHSLRDGAKCVNELAELLGQSQSRISRHLTMLRNAGIVTSQRNGYKVFYRIANPKITQVCDLMRDVLVEQFGKDSKLTDSFNE